MDPSKTAKLDEIFAQRREKERAVAVAEAQKKSAEEEFREAFVKVRDKVIIPALEEVAERLRAEGLNCRVTKTDEEIPGAGRRGSVADNAHISFGPGDKNYADHEIAGVSFSCDKHAKTVSVHERKMWPNSGGSVGGGKPMPLEPGDGRQRAGRGGSTSSTLS